jgi:phosphoribosylglycinamide formyltransferase-1
MRIGIIASSGGAVLKQTKALLDDHSRTKHQYYVVVDRHCPIVDYCKDNNITIEFIADDDNASFSEKAADLFIKNWQVNIVCLFYSRLVTQVLFANILTVNFHPSLLPDYKGFNAIENAIKDNYAVLGATLHEVDESVDGGSILAQTSTPITLKMKKKPALAHTASYLQKVYLMLLLIDKLESVENLNNSLNLSATLRESLSYQKSAPSYRLNNRYYEAFQLIQHQEKLEVI